MSIARTVLSCLLVLATGTGCGDDDSFSESPTGTFLQPREGISEQGYTVLDETCEETNEPDYLDRFRTPMFRDIALDREVALLVDGSLLWAIDMANPSKPSRLSLTRLPGHPLSLAVQRDGLVWVASGDAGLIGIDLTDPMKPQVISTIAFEGPALDVAMSDHYAFVATGVYGLVIVDLNYPAEPTVVSRADLSGFANAVDIEDKKAYLATCSGFSIVDVTSPQDPKRLGDYWVPGGHARGLDAVNDQLFVAGGEALFIYDIADPFRVRWTGYYDDPDAEGFYVNAVVVRDGVAYIAAGDESVRAIEVENLNRDSAVSALVARDDGKPPSLTSAIELPSGNLRTVRVVYGDPISVRLFGDRLYVLGNYRYVGERLVRIMDVSSPGELVDVGKYVQPNFTVGVDSHRDAVIVHRSTGEERVVTSQGIERYSFSLPNAVERGFSSGDQFFFLLDYGAVFRWSEGNKNAEPVVNRAAYDIAKSENAIFVSNVDLNTIASYRERARTDGSAGTEYAKVGEYTGAQSKNAFLGFSYLLYRDGHLYAYDWIMGTLHAFDANVSSSVLHRSVTHVGYCEMYDIADFYSGRKTIRARLFDTVEGFALLCPFDGSNSSSIMLFATSNPDSPNYIKRIELPDVRYGDLTYRNHEVFAVGFDNNTYLSTLAKIADDDVVLTDFDGHANGLTVGDDEILVADGDFGLRHFRIVQNGFEELTTIQE